MAKLLREYVDYKDIELIKEDIEVDGIKEKVIKLKGPMLGADVKNRNGRIYPKSLIEREVKAFNEEKIKTGMSRAELGHPSSPEINLDRVSHIIEELYMTDGIAIGVAKLIDTPMGRIAKTLVKEGQVLGMSSRGIGNLQGDIVTDSYKMLAIDIVDTPSFDKALMEAILENKEWIIQNDKWVEVAVSNLQQSVDKKYSGHDINNYLQSRFRTFINSIK